MKRELLAGLLLLAAAGALYWRNLQIEDQTPQQLAESEPDFVARALRTRSYDENGRLAAQIAADSMRHFQEEGRTEFTEPVYLIYPQDSEAVWKVQAHQGHLNGTRHVALENDVIITAIEPNEPLRTIRTESLQLDLETMVLTTEDPIRALGESFEVRGTGLWADLNLNQFKLNSKVSASYEVP
ncbi:LPS export ABC transporter periplasmic protein LptC [Ferrimonas balearica]|uniref:LPS export ABC transporter periplasmic protein LptC n=1 Tax=Ferrimonas balearica TaxID=44012 RepID=UPI001C56E792|nr:LPS export ABC transporter periplasmic protein LptC [Ferrimonas balearica]MBW3141000.1 LPS export ABC transporter periplasmic protein LptC [Ferrimonas balearica]MBW3165800.1 LPS export ABC transporter periplasmic protein LptC [Ferrimonas balearica]MBY6107976.1 LPS export ABC transporter periplasmic protein LptC [Ferrimonas balearica]MBY6225316.1 LPS export ABC transporter periplasmic protein LptC [Ferrimonas balearica]